MRRNAFATLLLLLVAWVEVLLAAPAAAAPPSSFTFSGSGWGHAIGMSQWGARGLAEQGRTYQEILTRYYTGTSVGSYPMPPEIRVGLLWDRADAIEVTGSATMQFVSGDTSIDVPPGEVWAVEATADGRFRIRRSDGSEAGVAGNTTSPLYLRFESLGSIVGLPDTGVRYRYGELEFNVYPAGGYLLRAVVAIPGFERYLYGLGEVPSSWPAHALKTQAVAARSYAVEKINRLGQHRPTCNCGVYATTNDQAYVGYEKEAGPFGASWVAAVDETAGQVPLYGGQPIQAYYSSANGGSSESNEQVWGGSPLPYLRAVYDPWSNHPSNPNALWTVTFTQSDIAARLGLARVDWLDLTDRTTGGGVRIARIGGNNGSNEVIITLSGDSLRSKLGLKSIKVNFHQFGEFLLLFNPGDVGADVELKLIFPDRAPVVVGGYQVAPHRRQTIALDELVPAGEVSVGITSSVPIAAERAMYFYNAGIDGGHVSRGVREPRFAWYFAEGATHGGFGEFLLLANPDPVESAVVDLVLQTPQGRTDVPGIVVAPGRRRTVAVDEYLPSSDVSISVASDGAPVVAERAMYFRSRDGFGYPIVDDGTVSEGAAAPSSEWYLPEGATHSGFSTFVLVQNPNSDQVKVAIDLYTSQGLAKTITKDMPGDSRSTVSLNAELPGVDVSTVVRSLTAGRGVVAERAVYFVQNLLDGGTASLGAVTPAGAWYLAEGATHSGFSTFVLVQNPNSDQVTVAIDLITPAGLAKTIERVMPGGARLTLDLNAELPGADISTFVRSLTADRGVVVERAMYFGGRGVDGGHASLGIPELSTSWLFAEGFTGW